MASRRRIVDLAKHPELRYRLPRGYIGFPDLGYAYSLRHIELQELGTRRKYIDLFDGRSIEGWHLRGGGNWGVRDGSIRGANGDGVLYAEPSFNDFEFTALVRSHNRVNSSVFLRGSPDPKQTRGFEIQIYSPPDAVYPTGSIYDIERAHVTADYEEQWFLLQVLVRGSSCLVRIDGETVAQSDRLPANVPRSGQIGLQIHKENSSVEFRDLRVRPLDSQ